MAGESVILPVATQRTRQRNNLHSFLDPTTLIRRPCLDPYDLCLIEKSTRLESLHLIRRPYPERNPAKTSPSVLCHYAQTTRQVTHPIGRGTILGQEKVRDESVHMWRSAEPFHLRAASALEVSRVRHYSEKQRFRVEKDDLIDGQPFRNEGQWRYPLGSVQGVT